MNNESTVEHHYALICYAQCHYVECRGAKKCHFTFPAKFQSLFLPPTFCPFQEGPLRGVPLPLRLVSSWGEVPQTSFFWCQYH